MAEWRALGFVPDSDEEDETQTSDHPDKLRFQHGFRDIDDIERDAEEKDAEKDGEVGDQYVSHELGETGKEVEGENACMSNGGGNNEASKPSRKDGQPNLSLAIPQSEHFESPEVASSTNDTDELQKDYYEATFPFQSGAQLSLAEIEEYAHSIPPSRSSPHAPWESPLSSPLTEPPPSPLDPVPSLGLEITESSPPISLVGSRSAPKLDNLNGQVANLETHADDGVLYSCRASRTLRQRNPIQLHPYAIESEKYRQVLKARGVKPLRIARTQESPQSQKRHNSEGREFEAEEESQPLNSEILINSSPPSLNEPLNSSSPGIDSGLAEEEFPEVSALVRQHFSHVPVGATKRRKVLHTFSKKNLRPSKQKRGREDPETPPLSTDSIFDNLHSPDRPRLSARRVLGPRADRGFRVPPGISPINPPTPATSSEPRRKPMVQLHRSKPPIIEISAESSNEENEDLANSDSASSENEADHQLEHMQRKMRGVLPASWLNLDLKTLKKKSEQGSRAQLHISPGKTEAQLGVARRIFVSGERSLEKSTETDFPIVISDNEDSDSVVNDFIRPEFPDEYSFGADNIDEINYNELQFDAAMGEVLEDNRVDEMLPSRNRSKTYTKKKGKHQIKLPAGEGVKMWPSGASGPQQSRVKSVYQPRITHHMKTGNRKKPKFRPPNLSILDAPKYHIATNTPRFLKVASRTARSRLDKGRHSPSHKFVRLATDGDTIDAHEMLRNWREGTILPVRLSNGISTTKDSDRQPLHARSGNVQSRLHAVPISQDVQGREPGPISARQPKAKSLPATKLRIQTSLDHIVQRHSKERRYARDKIKRLRKYQTGNHQPQDGGHLVMSLRNSNNSRPALLESLQVDDDRIHPRAAFRRHVLRANRTVHTTGASNILLDRFLDGNMQSSIEAARPGPELGRCRDKSSVPSRSRKRPPRRMKLDSSSFRQGSPSVHVDLTIDHQIPLMSQELGVLHGLGPFGTRYTQSFDILPLPVGVYIHSSTFVGSGRFYASLQLDRHAKMDIHKGFNMLRFDKEFFKWGPWNDQVSNQLGVVLGVVSERLQLISREADCQPVSSLLTNVINYFSDSLSFLDSIDRVSCLQRCKALLGGLLSEIDTQTMPPDESQQNLRLGIYTLLLIFANQLRQVSTHELVPQVLKAEIIKIVLGAGQRTLYLALNERFESLPACLANLGHLEACEYGIRENFQSVEALVVAHHVLRESNESLAAFWEIVRNTVIAQASNRGTEVLVLEGSWKKLFTILPFLEFDALGIIHSDQRFKTSNDGWLVAKQLISDVLQLHLLNSSGQEATFNAYCRALFGRCLHLVNAWGWNRCESIIGTMFDFFARNDLAHLSNEECHDSPRFLEHLDGKPDLSVSSEDRCFHIFLKIIGSGLHHLRKLHPEKKLRDIVWRLMPNHGRLHPKEETLCRRDLDAWRNHHDLLCTLYWASPPAVRPRLSVIRNLVHLGSSHREACHINIRAWSNLVRFQLSTDEDILALKAFADWHDDFLGQLLRQHYSARTEAEDHFQTARYNGDYIPTEVLETTIARNQRQVAVMLDDALVSLKLTIDAARNPEQATVLFTSALVPVFDLFDSRNSYSNRNIVQALEVVLAYVNKSLSSLNKLTNQDSNDDSQDYGDWPAFDDDAIRNEDQLPPQSRDLAATHLLNSFHEPIKQLLSNSFGADTVPEDGLLLKIIEVWVGVARILVRKGSRTWNDYISPFGTDCWESLRRTEQTQKFANYYLAILIENDAEIYQEYKAFFLASWMDALVERESMIKFQHRFTSDILNASSEDSLMRNLPFWIDPETSRFSISTSDFLGRRLSLISSLLSNMRESLEDAHQDITSDPQILRQEYQVLVKQLMNAMKRNYQELSHGSNPWGSYVEFVQRIIEFLQQHTLDVCSVDRFFTDSTAFPLPAADPTYVIGRLKNYGLRLQDSRTPKQLAVFLQSVSERAAVDGQQPYLVRQLHTAMSNVVERGDLAKPTLQSFLIEAIVPAYINVAFSTTNGWLLASPVLQALRQIFGGLLTSLDGTDAASIAGVVSIISAFLGSARRSMELLIDHSGLLEQSYTLCLLGLIYSGITALLPTLDYIFRLSETTPRVVESLDFFKNFATFCSKVLLDHEDVQSPDMEEGIDPICDDTGYREIREFALKELRHSLSRNWVCHDGHYYVVQGNTRREVVLASEHVLPFGEEKTRLFGEFTALRACWGAMPALGGGEENDGIIGVPVRKNLAAGKDLIII
ncbi:hypothetical protein MMC29_000232 [Sticta canariensis]|nr:hypothetical protein [Sticta canariensis]